MFFMEIVLIHACYTEWFAFVEAVESYDIVMG